MPSLNKTSELGLNQWSGSDYPKRDDFNNDNLIVDNAIKDLRKRIAGSLSDLNELKALDTTGMADNILIAVKALGIYKLDKTSMLTANDTSIIQPAKGTGRWINILYDANNYTDIKTDAIMDILRKGAVINPPINFGMNNKITIPEGGTSVQPRFTFKGKHSINVFGGQQYYKDISKWNTDRVSVSLDNSNKLYGSSSIKLTSTTASGDSGGVSIALPSIIDTTSKYYSMSIYLKNGNAPGGVELVPSNETDYWYSSGRITNTTAFTRIAFKIGGTATKVARLHVYLRGVTAVGQYGWIDGIQIEEITADQYNDTNYTPAPYHDSYSCLENPYIEIRHENLIRNGNCEEGVAWWEFYNTTIPNQFSVSNGIFNLMNLTQWQGVVQKVHVRPNTTYQLIGNSSNSSLIITANKIDGTWIGSANGHVTTDATTTDIYIEVINPTSSTISATFDHIMLIESDTLPTEYKPCKNEKIVLGGKFADGDIVTYQAGKIEGQTNWLHKTLYGKDYPWMMWGYFTGYKSVRYNHNGIYNNAGGAVNIVAKYDGKILPYADGNALTSGDMFNVDTLNTYITVSNSDSGWTDSIQPNDNEVKAFMNGWKVATGASDGTRYLAFVSIVDNSMPKGAKSTTVSTAITSGTNVMTVTDASIFAVNRIVIFKCNDGTWGANMIGSISGNTLTMLSNITKNVDAGATVFVADNGTTEITMLNYCINNIAPGFEGYQLHYELANPEPITDINCSVHGDILSLDVGDNYVYIDAGRIVGEQANPQYDGNSVYYINDVYPFPVSMPLSILQYKTECIEAIYKNMVVDTAWIFTANHTAEWSYGNSLAYISASSYDNKASYKVDYKILATIAPLLGFVACEYNTAVFEAIRTLEESVNSKQVHDTSLDNIIDLSMYEQTMIPNTIYAQWRMWTDTSMIIHFIINFSVRKKSIPAIILPSVSIIQGNVDCTNKFSLYSITPTIDNVRVAYITTDQTLINTIKTNGAYFSLTNIIADCR